MSQHVDQYLVYLPQYLRRAIDWPASWLLSPFGLVRLTTQQEGGTSERKLL